MWFLGAGTSRSAGLPTAYDLIWDLKRRYYCLHENQALQAHDTNNNAIRAKIQSFMDSKRFPMENSPEEYAFYFNLTFNEKLKDQQQYINDALASEKVSLNIGHRALAGLLAINKTKLIFTTNFDDVIESAYSNVTGKNLSSFHLEGSYAALSALNADRFPIYCKIHGDFRYQSIKNLPTDLLENDREIQKCFLAAAVRFGLVVTGYSGRDENVMSMFRAAIEQNNAFPQGLFWTIPRLSDASNRVQELIGYAQSRGVQAGLVETGTFDELLSKIWRQIDGKPPSLDQKVRTAKAVAVSIPLPLPGRSYPVLRLNALPLITPPARCGVVHLHKAISHSELKQMKMDKPTKTLIAKTSEILFWGEEDEVVDFFSEGKVKTVESFELKNLASRVARWSHDKAFVEEAIALALCWNKQVSLKHTNYSCLAVIEEANVKSSLFDGLRKALEYKGTPVPITGKVPGQKNVTWAEAISIQLEERNNNLWVMLQPEIWISPVEKRRDSVDFLRQRRLYRYNSQSSHLLSAWIEILLGEVGAGDTVKVTCYPDSKFKAVFEIGTRTAYSKGVGNG